MGKKNKDLCERSHCRERWTHLVWGLDPERYFGGRKWKVCLCPDSGHGSAHQQRSDQLEIGMLARTISGS